MDNVAIEKRHHLRNEMLGRHLRSRLLIEQSRRTVELLRQ